MNYLIDTHVLIWYLNGDKVLPEKYVDLMHSPQNTICISIVSVWEMAIKMSAKKLECDKTIQEIEEYILSKDYRLINISFPHLKTVFDLPKLHGDPFDRMLIAQAIAENLTIISVDKHFESYPVNVIW